MYYPDYTYHINYSGDGRLKLKTPPAEEPVSIDDLKLELRIDHSAEDSRLKRNIISARMWAEDQTNRQFVTATYQYYIQDFWGSRIEVPRPNLQDVVSVKYWDLDDTQQTLSTSIYEVDLVAPVGAIQLAESQSWPSVDNRLNAVEIEYTAGYGAAVDVPETIKQAILLKARSFYESCDDCNDDAAEMLLYGESIPEAP